MPESPTLLLPDGQPFTVGAAEYYDQAFQGTAPTEPRIYIRLELFGFETLAMVDTAAPWCILEAVAAGRRRFAEIFKADQEREGRPFMGDTTFRRHLERLASSERPLLVLADDTVTLTDDGRRVLAGEDDHVRLNGIDRWLGGVHLSGRTVWRWDAESGLVPPE